MMLKVPLNPDKILQLLLIHDLIGNSRANKKVFSTRLKAVSVAFGFWPESGRLFQVDGPATAKARWLGHRTLLTHRCTCLEQSSTSRQGCAITSVVLRPPEDMAF